MYTVDDEYATEQFWIIGFVFLSNGNVNIYNFVL